jgi:[NiFe] hydrogenase diaphorase moiety large subunit
MKWEACRNAPLKAGHTRIVVCNADEGEPGTFKDRVLLTSHADLVVRGHDGRRLRHRRDRGFSTCAANTATCWNPWNGPGTTARSRPAGSNILGTQGFDFDIEIHLGAGAYVCGEESALIESLEGKPGRPRIRPPFPVTNGYLDQPTVGEQRRDLRLRGPDRPARRRLVRRAWHGKIRRQQDPVGQRRLRAARHLRIPFGVTVRQVLEDCGATDTQAVQISGPSGICVAAEFGRRIAFEDLATAGAFMVFDESRDMFEVARNFAHFFAHESCGFCTPCRVGTPGAQPDGQDRARPRLALRHQRTVQAAPRDAGRQPLRPGQLGLQPGVRHLEQVPPRLRAAPQVAGLSSRPSTWMPRCRRRGR